MLILLYFKLFLLFVALVVPDTYCETLSHLNIFDMPLYYQEHVSIPYHALALTPYQLALHFLTSWEPNQVLNYYS